MLKGSTTPRIYTKPLSPLEPRSPETEARTLGYSAIDFAEQVCEIQLYPWQRWLLLHALERETPAGDLRYKTVVVTIARQSGKSSLSQVLALWSMYVYPHLVKLPVKVTILGTAQDLDTAEAVWEGALDMIEETPDLAELADRPVKTNGKKAIRLLSGEQYKVKAANRKAGRGLSGDLIILDELREHQSWDAWGAVTKTTIARPHAQVWALSNAGDLTSVVLRHLRNMAHRALGDPDGILHEEESALAGPTALDVDGDEELEPEDLEADVDTLGWFEWSAPPGCDKWDRSAWAQANPSLGYGLVTEKTLASACRTDPEWVFRTEVMCQWSDGVLEGPFPPGSWEKGVNEVLPGPDGKSVLKNKTDRIAGDVWACVDTAHDRAQTYIAFAGRRPDGLAQVEVVAGRYGQDWVKAWLMDEKRRGRILGVTGQTRGAPVSSLMKNLDEDVAFTIPVVEWAGSDIMGAFSDVFDAVRDVKVKHNPQGPLDVAAQVAVTKALGDGKALDRQHSPVDIAPLVAFEGALWLLLKYKPPPPPPAALPMAVPTDDDDDEYGTADLVTLGF